MFAVAMRAVVRGIVIDELDVGGEADTGKGTLDQIVAEQGVARKSSIEHRMEGCHFIDSLAGEDTFVKQILVSVRNRACINIEACLAGVDGRQARTRCGLN